MTSIYHMTPTALDPLSFMVMGLSAKDDDSAIGKFGTGMKYAIAGIIRCGGEIIITCEGTSYYFTRKKELFRGTEFTQVLCNGKPLGYTTDLGKHWKPWMMFRELHSNTLDEKGTTSTEWSRAETVIEVRNFPDYVAAFRNRSHYFLTDDVKVVCEDSYFGRLIADGSAGVFHKGVRVYEVLDFDLEIGGLSFDLPQASITEDRTLAAPSTQLWTIAHLLGKYDNLAHLIEKDATGEMNIPSQIYSDYAFIDGAVKAYEANPKLQMHENIMLKVLPKIQAKNRDFYELTEAEQKVLDEALSFVATPWTSVPAGWSVGSGPLPARMLGLCVGQQSRIYVARELLDGKQPKQLCEVLIEEIIHAQYGVDDYSRDWQNAALNIIGMLLLMAKRSPFLAAPKFNEIDFVPMRGGSGGGGKLTFTDLIREAAAKPDEDIPF